jgi:hypothetical protein
MTSDIDHAAANVIDLTTRLEATAADMQNEA